MVILSRIRNTWKDPDRHYSFYRDHIHCWCALSFIQYKEVSGETQKNQEISDIGSNPRSDPQPGQQCNRSSRFGVRARPRSHQQGTAEPWKIVLVLYLGFSLRLDFGFVFPAGRSAQKKGGLKKKYIVSSLTHDEFYRDDRIKRIRSLVRSLKIHVVWR